jgi:hypothetical protein
LAFQEDIRKRIQGNPLNHSPGVGDLAVS